MAGASHRLAAAGEGGRRFVGACPPPRDGAGQRGGLASQSTRGAIEDAAAAVSRRPASADTGPRAHAALQGPQHPSYRPRTWLRVRGRSLPVLERRRQGDHRLPLQRLPVFPAVARRRRHDETDPAHRSAAPSIRASRPKKASTRNSTRSMRSGRRARHSSRARFKPAGSACRNPTTTAVTPVRTWSGRRCSVSSPISMQARST